MGAIYSLYVKVAHQLYFSWFKPGNKKINFSHSETHIHPFLKPKSTVYIVQLAIWLFQKKNFWEIGPMAIDAKSKNILNSFESPTGAFQTLGALSKNVLISHRSWYVVYLIYKTTSRASIRLGNLLPTSEIAHHSNSDQRNWLVPAFRLESSQMNSNPKAKRKKEVYTIGDGKKKANKRIKMRKEEVAATLFASVEGALTRFYEEPELRVSIPQKSIPKMCQQPRSLLMCPS